MLTGVPFQRGDTQLREAWITNELLMSDKSILSFSQTYHCRLCGGEPDKDLLVNTCLLHHFLSCIGEEGINSMSIWKDSDRAVAATAAEAAITIVEIIQIMRVPKKLCTLT